MSSELCSCPRAVTYNLCLRVFLPPGDSGTSLPEDMILLSLLLFPVGYLCGNSLVPLGCLVAQVPGSDLSCFSSLYLHSATVRVKFSPHSSVPLALSSETLYQRARHCAGPEKHRSESGYEVSLACQSFIPTEVQMIGPWHCPQGPSECFKTAEKEVRSLVSPEANEQ